MRYKLVDLAAVIRSKNSGPYELTFDIMFKSEDVYKRVTGANIVNKSTFAALYNISAEDIMEIVHFDPAYAIKVTIARPVCSGDLKETDVYGAQQHAPLMGLTFELDPPLYYGMAGTATAIPTSGCCGRENLNLQKFPSRSI